MRLLHWLEIRNFKRFGDKQRIELDHPAVLIGPNNSGKTTAIQAIALWSQAVRTWFDIKGEAPPKERTSTSLNRLNIISVPVQRTRYFWHNAAVRTGNRDIKLQITLGVLHENKVEPVTMQFRNQGNELVYCTPDEATLARPELIERAAAINVELLYPMSGIETEEPLLQPGRIDVLLGQGQTAQVLRNLCLIVFRESPEDWKQITGLVERLFRVRLADPEETARGAIDLFYRQDDVRERLDVALAGRGLQQMLLIFAHLYSHRGSVLLIDEPDAHLEILRQKQVYVLLREIAARNESQVVLVTHSEVILQEALDHNLTLLLEGQADDLAQKTGIRNALKHYGADHYVRARQRGYVLYVEGGTDLDNLRALGERLSHRAAETWDERINAFYVQDNFPGADMDSELSSPCGGWCPGSRGWRFSTATASEWRGASDRLLDPLRSGELLRDAGRPFELRGSSLPGHDALRRLPQGDGGSPRRADPGARLPRTGRGLRDLAGARRRRGPPGVGGGHGPGQAQRLRRGVLPPPRRTAEPRHAPAQGRAAPAHRLRGTSRNPGGGIPETGSTGRALRLGQARGRSMTDTRLSERI